MKVSELIKMLQEQPQDLEVIYNDHEEGYMDIHSPHVEEYEDYQFDDKGMWDFRLPKVKKKAVLL